MKMGTQLQIAGAWDVALGNLLSEGAGKLILLWVYTFFKEKGINSLPDFLFSFNSG